MQIKSKAQSKIVAVAKLAEEQQNSAEEIVQIIEEELDGAVGARTQTLLLIADCILKRVGKNYKAQFSSRIGAIVTAVHSKADADGRAWLQRMVNDSWRKYDLLPVDILGEVDRILAAPPKIVSLDGGIPQIPKTEVLHAGQPPVKAGPPPSQVQPKAMQPPGPTIVKEDPRQPQVVSTAHARAATLPMKAPSPATGPAVIEPVTGSSKPVAQPPVAAPTAQAATDTPEVVERRLHILTKIIERTNPTHDELKEIMKVPEIKRAIAMQHGGQKHEATAVLSQFKKDLERRHAETKLGAQPSLGVEKVAQRPADPRQVNQKVADPRQLDPRQSVTQAQLSQQASRPTDPRQVDPRRPDAQPTDPRQPDVKRVDPRLDQKPVDPMQTVDARPAEQKQQVASKPSRKQVPKTELLEQATGINDASFRQQPKKELEKQVKLAPDEAEKVAPPPAAAKTAPTETIVLEGSDDEPEDCQAVVPGESVEDIAPLQGLPTTGFSEAWLRQFLQQIPTPPSTGNARQVDEPCVGRKVLSASGDHVVHVGELSSSQVLHLMQFIFLMEERLRSTGGGIDITQRIPHTFNYLQVEPAIDVMLKRFFDELPLQCTTTGLRFASRDQLRKHHDRLYRRRTLLQQRQRGAEARGWMESIPEWVGNRDLVVGAALFRLGGAGEDASKAAEVQRGGGDHASDGEDQGESRWICPLDERRSVCPISGEPFERTWSAALNDWAYTDVVAVELGSTKPIKFNTDGNSARQKLSETAVLFKKSCFFNTPLSKRQQAVEECNALSVHAPGPDGTKDQGVQQDAELVALAQVRPLSTKFF